MVHVPSAAAYSVAWQSKYFSVFTIEDHQIMNFILIALLWDAFELFHCSLCIWFINNHFFFGCSNTEHRCEQGEVEMRKKTKLRNNWNFLWEWSSKSLFADVGWCRYASHFWLKKALKILNHSAMAGVVVSLWWFSFSIGLTWIHSRNHAGLVSDDFFEQYK